LSEYTRILAILAGSDQPIQTNTANSGEKVLTVDVNPQFTSKVRMVFTEAGEYIGMALVARG